MADKIKFALALLFLIAGVASFHYFADLAAYLRAPMVLAGVALSAAVAWHTDLGRRFFIFAKEARDETKKVVWPTRKETWQMTLVVFAFVLVMAIFLGLVDKSLEWVIYELILRRGA